GGEPDAGRHLLGWAHLAGLTDVRCTASAWCFATPEDREWWAGTWAVRVTESALARQAVRHRLATPADPAQLARGGRPGAAPHGWSAMLHGEVPCRHGG